MGKVTTFYSYKGGSGRSMSMANVAWALATNGERVLVIDWDLEAPGLHRYFHPFLADPEQENSDGLIDRVWDYIEWVGTNPPQQKQASKDKLKKLADVRTLAQPLDLPLRTRNKGCLDFIGAGRQDNAYSEKVRGLDWQHFYSAFGGETFINEFMAQARERYEHILIDSRTGVADTAGVCTIQIPDHVVLCFVYNRQSIEGTVAIAKSIRTARNWGVDNEHRFTLLPSRVEERAQVDAARKFAAERFSSIFDVVRPSLEMTLRRNEIRHYPWCAFEEKLAVFEDTPEERGSLLDMMNELAAKVAEKKSLKIANIDRNVLTTIWRKASFQDPRFAELLALKGGPSDAAIDLLLRWAPETLTDTKASPEWLAAMAEAIFEVGNVVDDRLPATIRDFLGHCAEQFARRAFEASPEEYRSVYVSTLRHRAVQHVRQDHHSQGRDLLEKAMELVAQRKDYLSRWRYAGLMELRAEFTELAEGLFTALPIYNEAVAAYERIQHGPIALQLGAGPVRARRILAEKLFTVGRLQEAYTASERAFDQLKTPEFDLAARYPGEALRAITIRAECIAALSLSGGDSLDDLRAAVKKVLRGSMMDVAEQKIILAEARMHLRLLGYHVALKTILDALGRDNPLPEVIRFAAQVLLKLRDDSGEILFDPMSAHVMHTVSTETFGRVLGLIEKAKTQRVESRSPPELIGLEFMHEPRADTLSQTYQNQLAIGNATSFPPRHLLNFSTHPDE